jgi:hypothetical protein
MFLLLCALAVLVRLALVATTLGTNDAIFWNRWAALVAEAGIPGAYGFSRMVNHPPLALILVRATDLLAGALGIVFTDVFRLLQVLADVLSAFALYRIGSGVSAGLAQRLALFVLLSPAAAFVSGFHCNSDPLMIALVAVAAMLAMEWRSGMAGVVLGLAAGIKVVPFLLMPIFVASAVRRARFVVAFAATAAAIYLPVMVGGGTAVIRNLFGYAGGLPYEWGIPGVAFGTAHAFPSFRAELMSFMSFYNRYGRWAVYAGLVAVIILAFRRRPLEPLQYTAILLLTMFALAPGFGVQYIVWLIPAVPFALPWRAAVAVNAAASIYLFITYTVWSGGWPWWFADMARPGPYRFLPAIAGYAMWAIVCAALAVALRRGRRSGIELQTPTEALPPLPGSGSTLPPRFRRRI